MVEQKSNFSQLPCLFRLGITSVLDSDTHIAHVIFFFAMQYYSKIRNTHSNFYVYQP